MGVGWGGGGGVGDGERSISLSLGLKLLVPSLLPQRGLANCADQVARRSKRLLREVGSIPRIAGRIGFPSIAVLMLHRPGCHRAC